MSTPHHVRHLPPTWLRLAICFVIGSLAGVIIGLSTTDWPVSTIVTWDVTALIYLLWIWLKIAPLDHHRTASLAIKEDPGRKMTDAILILASVSALAIVVWLMIEAVAVQDEQRVAVAVLGILSIIISWLLVHTIFLLRYARLYYTGNQPGGVDFNQADNPTYTDFAYLAFTIGTTYQVSDTNISNPRIRATVLRHALVSYLFGTVIVAATINLIAGLSK